MCQPSGCGLWLAYGLKFSSKGISPHKQCRKQSSLSERERIHFVMTDASGCPVASSDGDTLDPGVCVGTVTLEGSVDDGTITELVLSDADVKCTGH